VFTEELSWLRQNSYLKGRQGTFVSCSKLAHKRGFTTTLLPGDKDIDRMSLREVFDPFKIFDDIGLLKKVLLRLWYDQITLKTSHYCSFLIRIGSDSYETGSALSNQKKSSF
jgi:hypothetical protein